MNISRTPKYLFENDILQFESLINDFTDTIYDEFDAISKELEVKQKIDDLFEGELVNYTENRAATHPYERKRHKLYHLRPGYFKEQNAKERALFQFARKINFEATPTWLESWLLPYKKVNLITLGIGGSYEGPKLLKESMSSKWISEKIEHHFITGSDKKEFDSKIEKLDPKKTFFIVFSKSFLTQETVELFKEAITWSKDHDKFLFITSNPDEVKKYECFGKRFDENPMENSIYTFDETIGGRYSIWLDIISNIYGDRNFIEGGRRADQHLIDSSDYLNFVKRLSYTDIWNHNTKEKNVRAVLSYVWPFRSFPDYVQQLEMESLGKHANPSSQFKKTGQVVFGGYGPTAQHSYFQLLHQGTNEICADIIASSEDKKSLPYAQAITQSKLLAYGEEDKEFDNPYAAKLAERSGDIFKINGNVPVNLFLLNKTDPFTLGYLIATWEHRTFITACMLGINPFDQFGVSAGKIYTKKYLDNKD